MLHLVATRINSVAEMEALLLMREEPKDWTISDLSHRLYISVGEAQRVAQRLRESQLIQGSEDAGYRYGPETDELRTSVDQLATAYRTRLIAITKLIHSKAAAAPSNIQIFAEAFRLRKE